MNGQRKDRSFYGNMIALAAKQGTDPAMNPSLAMAIEKAKQL